MPRFSVGEFAIKKGESVFLFRPSFSALDKIGNSSDIMQAFINLQIADENNPKWHEISLALNVLQSCCEKELPEFFGYMIESKGKPKFKYKSIPAHDLVIFARKLIMSGVYGEPKRESKKTDNNDSKFNPIEFVSCAVEHLNVNIKDAWDLTMIEFQRLYDAKFPPEKEDHKGMTADDIDDLEAAIAKKKGERNG